LSLFTPMPRIYAIPTRRSYDRPNKTERCISSFTKERQVLLSEAKLSPSEKWKGYTLYSSVGNFVSISSKAVLYADEQIVPPLSALWKKSSSVTIFASV